jgi:hypothetical protein
MLMSRVLAALPWLFVVSASACSLVSCLDDGIEMRGDFLVSVKYEGKPLPGVDVKVTTSRGDTGVVRFSGTTGANGTVKVINLLPGDYWFSAELLGFSAAYHCFHVSQRASWRAKRRVVYTWGEYSVSTNTVEGRITDPQPGTSVSQLWNLLHMFKVPIEGAKVSLQNALTGERFATKSDRNGAYAIEGVPPGIYALHIEGTDGGRSYHPTDELIKVSAASNRSTLDFERGEDGCGGTELSLRWR